MTKLLICIDGSIYTDNICAKAALVSKAVGGDIDLLHVSRHNSDYLAPSGDHTGAIGVGARNDLLNALTKMDEERGKIDQKKGKLILDHAGHVLKSLGVKVGNVMHRRGGVVETIKELEPSYDMIFVGKRGEGADSGSDFLASNLEKIIRSAHKPIFVVSKESRPISRFLIAYDGKDSSNKSIDYLISKSLFKGAEGHLVVVESEAGEIDSSGVKKKIQQAGFNILVKHESGANADKVIADYVAENNIDVLIAGAYSHSRLHGFLLGSTTWSLIKNCNVPLFLFK